MSVKLKNPQTFRVFFSSPFKGMEDEREELTRRYVPQIQHMCSEKGLQFVAVDMRWGITKEASENGQTICICLRELDRSDMFIGFFGQRYGWHGVQDKLLQQNVDCALGKYPWLHEFRDRSITEMEFLHGFLNTPGVMPACFCFRDKQYDAAMEEMNRNRADCFKPENESAREKLDDLKQRVWNSHLKTQNVVFHMDYPNPLEGARLMFESIKMHLEKNLLAGNAEMSRREKDLSPHKAFMISRTSLYIERKNETKSLSDKLETNQNVLILGPAGCGKSALLCNWLQNDVMDKHSVLVIPFFIGSGPNTRDPEEILNFILGELEYHLNNVTNGKMWDENLQANGSRHLESVELIQTDWNTMYNQHITEQSETMSADKKLNYYKADVKVIEKATDEKANMKKDSSNTDNDRILGDNSSSNPLMKETTRPKGKELMMQILAKLKQLVQQGMRVVLAFDGLHCLVPANKTSKHLYWLPENLPDGVTCVVTTNETDTASAEILVTQRKFHVLRVPPLTENMKKNICVLTLKQCGKELSDAQVSCIVSTEQTSSPLFLKILLAELSIYGDFRGLDMKIHSLISQKSIKALLQSYLERLEADYNVKEYKGNLVEEILLALLVVYEGLSESEIMALFNIQSHVWSPLFFAMEYFLISNMGLLTFAFAEIKEAVKEKYMQNEETKTKVKRQIIEFFDKKRLKMKPWFTNKQLCEKQNVHAVCELVWLQKSIGDRNGLVNTLTDLSVLYILNHEYELDLLELWQWTEVKWRDICGLYLQTFDQNIVDLFLANDLGIYDENTCPGVKMRKLLVHIRHLFSLANYHAGEERALNREISLLENVKGKLDEKDRNDVLRDACYHLACCFASQDHYDKSYALHTSNLDELEKAYAETPTTELRRLIAFTQNGLGVVCMNIKLFDQAIEHFLKSSAYHNEQKDKKNEASCYTNMGLVYMYKNNLDKALEYDKMALEAYEEAYFGQLPLDVGNLLTNMGIIYRRKHDLVKAEEMYQKSLAITANAVGWDHPLVATAYMNLGTLEMHRSNYNKGEDWSRKAITIYEMNEFGKEKKEYRRCRENLFVHLLNQGKYKEALPLFIDIFDILKNNGWLDECLAHFHRQMVDFMIEQEMYDKAEEVTVALMASPKVHPDNYIQLDTIDRCRLKKCQAVPVRPYNQTLDYALEKYVTHKAFKNLVHAKLSGDILPKSNKLEMQKLFILLRDSKVWVDVTLINELTTMVEAEGKTAMLVDALIEMVQANPAEKEILLMLLRVCVKMNCLDKLVPLMDSVCDENASAVIRNLMQPVSTAADRTLAEEAPTVRTNLNKEEKNTEKKS